MLWLPLVEMVTWDTARAAYWFTGYSGGILQRGTTFLWAHRGQSWRPAERRGKLTVILTSHRYFCGYFAANFFFPLWKWRTYLPRTKQGALFITFTKPNQPQVDLRLCFLASCGVLTWLTTSTRTSFSATTLPKGFWCLWLRPLRLNPGVQEQDQRPWRPRALASATSWSTRGNGGKTPIMWHWALAPGAGPRRPPGPRQRRKLTRLLHLNRCG